MIMQGCSCVLCTQHNSTQQNTLCCVVWKFYMLCTQHNNTQQEIITFSQKLSFLNKNYHFLAQIIIFWSKIIIFLVKNYLILVIMLNFEILSTLHQTSIFI